MAKGIGDLLLFGLDMRLPMSKRLDIVPLIVVIVYRTILMGGMVITFPCLPSVTCIDSRGFLMS